MSSDLKVSAPQLDLHTRLDLSLKAPEAQLHTLHQLCLNALQQPLPEGFIDPKTLSLNYRFPAVQILGRLNRVNKIAVLFCAVGPWVASEKLREMGFEELVKCRLPDDGELEKFSAKLSQLADGRITSYQISALHMLQVHLCASLQVLCNNEVPGDLLDPLFLLTDSLAQQIKEDQLSQPEKSKFIALGGSFRERLEEMRLEVERNPHSRPRLEHCDRLLAISDLLIAAFGNPAMLSLLQRPVEETVAHHIKKEGPNASSRGLEWMENSLAAFRLRSTHFVARLPALLRENNCLSSFLGQVNSIKRLCQNGADEMNRVVGKMQRLCQKATNLDRTLELSEQFVGIVKELKQILGASFFPLRKEGTDLFNALNKRTFNKPHIRDSLELQFWQGVIPLFSVSDACIIAVCTSFRLQAFYSQDIKRALDTTYIKSKSPHIALVDLLEASLRGGFNGFDESRKKNEQVSFDMLLLLFAEIRTARGSYASRLPQVRAALDYLEKNFNRPSPLLYLLRNVSQAVCSELGVAFFQRNPYAPSQGDPEATNTFFHHNYMMLLQSLEEFDVARLSTSFEISFKLPVHESEKIMVEEIREWVNLVRNFMLTWQRNILTTPLTSDRAEIGIFLENVGQIAWVMDQCQELGERIDRECKSPSIGLTALLRQFKWMRSTLHSRIISFSRPLMLRRLEEEMSLMPEVKEVPSTPPATQKQPKSVEQSRLQQSYKQFLDRCQAIAPLNEHGVVVRHLAEELREMVLGLPQHGHQPFFVSQLYLKMATAMEQTARYTADLQGMVLPEGHAISPLLKAIQTKMPLNFDASEWDRVIGVSARYPALGRDRLSATLERAFSAENIEEIRNEEEELLESVLDICSAMLGTDSVNKQDPSSLLTVEQIRTWLTPLPDEGNLEASTAVHAVARVLHRLKLLQVSLRSVPPLHEWDESCLRRKNTLSATLNNLESSLQMCQTLLSFPEEPALCATVGSAILLQQAVLQEQLQLAHLALLPIRSLQHEDQHFLFDLYEKKMERYSHSLLKFDRTLKAHRVVLSDEPEEGLRFLELFLKNHFRYYKPGIPDLDKLYGLSKLRDFLLRDELEPLQEMALEQALGDTKLEAYMALTLRQMKKGLVDKLQQVVSGLQKLEERMRESQ